MAYKISCTVPNALPKPFGIATKGSLPRRPKINQEVPHKNTKSDRKNGMNSTLLVLITILMIVRGEAYMVMEKIVAAKPQNNFLPWPWRANKETNTTAANTVMTRTRMEKIFVFSFLGAKMRKISTYMDSIAAPVPLIVDTSMLCGDTKGNPYHAESKQFSKVMT